MKKFRFLFLLLILWSCENKVSVIPDTPVYVERNLKLSEGIKLSTIGGYLAITKPEKITDRLGYGGILIFYGFDENYYAFDMACTKEVSGLIRVVPDSIVPGQAICPVCGSVFNVGWGSGNCIDGPANEGLRKYTVSDRGNILYVTQ